MHLNILQYTAQCPLPRQRNSRKVSRARVRKRCYTVSPPFLCTQQLRDQANFICLSPRVKLSTCHFVSKAFRRDKASLKNVILILCHNFLISNIPLAVFRFPQFCFFKKTLCSNWNLYWVHIL